MANRNTKSKRVRRFIHNLEVKPQRVKRKREIEREAWLAGIDQKLKERDTKHAS